MRLTQKQIKQLDTVLYHLERANKYLMNPELATAMRCRMATTTLHYTRGDGKVLYEVEKEYGSDLVGLRDGIRLLRLFINGPKVEQIEEE